VVVEPIELLPGGDSNVALTFDDGPHPVFTSLVLDALIDAQLPATFFVIGHNVENHPQLIEALLNAGMSIGVHGWSHTVLRSQDEAFVTDELSRTLDLLRSLGVDPCLFRPPRGFWDQGVLSVAARLGLLPVNWSVDPLDWQGPPVNSLVDRVRARIHPGAIVLLHDGGDGDRSGTVAAIPRLGALFQRGGYGPVDLTEALKGVPTEDGQGANRSI
jgi:peptidoglycan/xylan/chitin deacetylase (PgdA/CDA1 family)